MSAEDHYLDAIEALDNGNREEALNQAYKTVKLDPEHTDAWQLISDSHLNSNGQADSLIDASKSLNASSSSCAISLLTQFRFLPLFIDIVIM